jgi:hypothetical protein
MIISSVIVALVAYLIFFVASRFLALLLAAFWIYGVYKLIPKLKLLKKQTPGKFNPVPLYFILIPILTLVFQLTLAAPITEWSRDRAIANSSEFIRDIENYHAQYGRYPISLLAQNKDYQPGVIGVDKYHYSPQGDSSYNLFFEQPKFLLDNFGTREWVVYNPRDEQHVYSHTSWFLLVPPEELETSQGWYEVHDDKHPHWKYFWFD